MSYYFIFSFLIICIIVDIIIIRKGFFNKYKSEVKESLTFTILFIPVLFLLIKLYNSSHILENEPFIIRGMIIGIILLLIDIIIYLFIKKGFQKKRRINGTS